MVNIDPIGAGFDEQRLARIDEHLDRNYISPGKIAGCQTAVVRGGTLAHFSSLGSMDLERAKPMADDTIFRIYSMTKPITGVALMSLYEEGRFKLADPLHRFIPEFRDLKVEETAADGTTRLVAAHRPLTVRDAMMHMTGLGIDWFEKRAGLGAGGLTLESMCTELAASPLAFQPGTKWFYSVSTDVCARLVEVISGQRFDDYLHATIFEPLGMVDTSFQVTDDKLDRFAANYRRSRKTGLALLDDPQTSAYRSEPTFLSGGGGLVSTTRDYVRFVTMLAKGGTLDGARILGRRTIEFMTTNHLPGGGEQVQLSDVLPPEDSRYRRRQGLHRIPGKVDVGSGGVGRVPHLPVARPGIGDQNKPPFTHHVAHGTGQHRHEHAGHKSGRGNEFSRHALLSYGQPGQDHQRQGPQQWPGGHCGSPQKAQHDLPPECPLPQARDGRGHCHGQQESGQRLLEQERAVEDARRIDSGQAAGHPACGRRHQAPRQPRRQATGHGTQHGLHENHAQDGASTHEQIESGDEIRIDR